MEYKYRVKVIPKQKKDFIVISWHGVNEKFKTPLELKMKLLSTLSEHLPPTSEIDLFEVGYMEGRRQTKRWIISGNDIAEMYKTAPNDHEILWRDGKDVTRVDRKRKAVDDNDTSDGRTASKRASIFHEEVETLTQELKSIHGEKYSYAQYKIWARMIINGQHRDKETSLTSQ